MSYVNWDEITEEIDMDFLNPLLDEISDIYRDQWQDASYDIISNDPYGSIYRDLDLSDAYQGYNSQAARQKSDTLIQYYNSMLNNNFINQIEEMGDQYQDLMDEYEEYQEEHPQNQYYTSSSWLNNYLNSWLNLHSNSIQQSQVPQQTGSSNTSQTVTPIGGTIINPEMLTDYDPFANNIPSEYVFPTLKTGGRGTSTPGNAYKTWTGNQVTNESSYGGSSNGSSQNTSWDEIPFMPPVWQQIPGMVYGSASPTDKSQNSSGSYTTRSGKIRRKS